MSLVHTLFLTAAILFAAVSPIDAHGIMSWPRQRGILGRNDFNLKEIHNAANPDYCPHCLNAGGSGTVAANSPGRRWTPYEPTSGRFRFRGDHGLCGDQKGGRDHMAPDGKYYEGVTIATYERGDYIDMEIIVNAHHNGFFQFFICNVGRCGDRDISRNCFTNGFCQRLLRVPNKSCQSGQDRFCGPIDPKYPGRWYLPPRNQQNPSDNRYGGLDKKMRYALPKKMTCQRCVIQWSWTTANSCNPTGYARYNFPRRWNGIPGDGGSLGGINRFFGECGAQFPEEFWSCSENIRIVPKNGGRSRTIQIFRNGKMRIAGPR